MKRCWLLLLGGLIVTVLVTGCSSQETALVSESTQPEVVNESVVLVAMDSQVEIQSELDTEDSPDPMLPIDIPVVDDNCLNCHTNVEVLQELGEEEVVIKLSEGKG